MAKERTILVRLDDSTFFAAKKRAAEMKLQGTSTLLRKLTEREVDPSSSKLKIHSYDNLQTLLWESKHVLGLLGDLHDRFPPDTQDLKLVELIGKLQVHMDKLDMLLNT